MTQRRKDKHRHNIKQKNRRNRMSDLLILRMDHRRRRRDCRPTTDRRPHPDQRRRSPVDPKQPSKDPRRQKSCQQSKAHHQKRPSPHLQHLKQIHLKAQQDHRQLKKLLPRKNSALLKKRQPTPKARSDPDSDQNTKHRTPDQWKITPQHPRQSRQTKTQPNPITLTHTHPNPSIKPIPIPYSFP